MEKTIFECGQKGETVDISDQSTGSISYKEDFHTLNDEPSSQSAESLKKQGNEEFKAGNIQNAIDLYSKAIDLQPHNHIYLANRSVALGVNNEWEKAAEDAEKVILLDGSYVKGYFRLASAQLHLGLAKQALATCKKGLGVEPGNKELIRLAHKAKSQSQVGCSATGPKGKKKAGSFLKNTPLYEDLTEETPTARMLRKLKESMSVGSGQRDFEGIFSKLMDKTTFQKTIFPGLSEEQRAFAPQSFEALLADQMYSGELESLMPKTEARAKSVLENVKKKGADMGQIMDAATEERLRPQVLQEAFAREVLVMVANVHRAAHAKVAESVENLASLEDDRASWDQLDPEVVSSLVDPSISYAIQDDFLGEEWPALLCDDTLRFMSTGQLTPIPTPERIREGKFGEIAFIEPNQLEESYPAIEELVKNLHALPFELRSKQPSLKLMAPLPGSTALVCMKAGCHQNQRLDCGTESEYTGYKFTCVYFFSQPGTLASGGDMYLTHRTTQEEKVIHPISDRLVIFDSRNVYSEKKEIEGLVKNFQQYSITFWIHGCKE